MKLINKKRKEKLTLDDLPEPPRYEDVKYGLLTRLLAYFTLLNISFSSIIKENLNFILSRFSFSLHRLLAYFTLLNISFSSIIKENLNFILSRFSFSLHRLLAYFTLLNISFSSIIKKNLNFILSRFSFSLIYFVGQLKIGSRIIHTKRADLKRIVFVFMFIFMIYSLFLSVLPGNEKVLSFVCAADEVQCTKDAGASCVPTGNCDDFAYGLSGDCTDCSDIGTWTGDGGENSCCGDDTGEDYCSGGNTACYNAVYYTEGDDNYYTCQCGGDTWLSYATTGEGGQRCCGDDGSLYFESFDDPTPVSGESCCYIGQVLTDGAHWNPYICSNGALYSCNDNRFTWDTDHTTSTCTIVEGRYCNANDEWLTTKPDGCSCSSDSDCTSGNCDNEPTLGRGSGSPGDQGVCFSLANCDGTSTPNCGDSNVNPSGGCQADGSTTSTECDDYAPSSCAGSSGYCTSVCAYQSDGDTDSDTCTCVAGAGYWNLGGEISATTCCEDGADNVVDEHAYSESIAFDNDETACCDASTDCVANDVCFASDNTPATGSESEETNLNSGGDDDVAYCFNSGGNGQWLDCDQADYMDYWCGWACGPGLGTSGDRPGGRTSGVPDSDWNAVISGEDGTAFGEYDSTPGELECCGDDSPGDGGENYMYYQDFGGASCDDSTDDHCFREGGDNSTDDVCCNDDDDCVLDFVCYAEGTYKDADGDGRIDGWCMTSDSYKGHWRDCDGSATSQGASCDGSCSGTWSVGGESGAFGEYNTGTSTECCGDDSGEEYLSSSYHSSIESPPSSTDACCDVSTDCVDASTCYANTGTADVDSTGDIDYCSSGTWLDCTTIAHCDPTGEYAEGESSNACSGGTECTEACTSNDCIYKRNDGWGDCDINGGCANNVCIQDADYATQFIGTGMCDSSTGAICTGGATDSFDVCISGTQCLIDHDYDDNMADCAGSNCLKSDGETFDVDNDGDDDYCDGGEWIDCDTNSECSAGYVCVSGDCVDNVPPSCEIDSIDEMVNGEYQYVSGTTIYYNNYTTGSFKVNVTAEDAVSGVSNVTYPATVSSGAEVADTPYNHTYNWVNEDNYNAQATVYCYDHNKNENSTTFTVTLDNTAPSGGSITYDDGLQDDSVDVTFADGSDGGSGVNASSTRLLRHNATLTGTSCGSYDAWEQIGSNNPTSVYTDTDVKKGQCYQYRYEVYDNVMNVHNYTSGNTAKIGNNPIINSNGTIPLKLYYDSNEGGKTVYITANATDVNGDLLTINFTVTAPNGTNVIENENATARNLDIYNSTTFTMDQYGEWNYTIRAYDGAGLFDELNVSINFLQITETLTPSTTNITKSVVVSGQINDSSWSNVVAHEIYLWVNDTEINVTDGWNCGNGWWDCSWRYRKNISLENLISTTVNDSIVLINFSTTSLISEGKMNNDCSDVRFADSTEAELEYTLETSTCNSANTLFWVWGNWTEDANTTIYAYYGNSDASLPTDYTNPDNSLVFYMHLDKSSAYGEDDSKIFDFSKNGNNGTCSDCPAYTSTGKYGGAFTFDGEDDYITVSTDSTLDIEDTITLMAWIKINETVDNQRIIAKGSNDAYEIWMEDNDNISFSINNGTAETIIGKELSIYTWYHVAGTYNNDTGTIKLYVNGALEASHTFSGKISTTGEDLIIGNWDNSDSYDATFNGTIDEVRIYNRDLSADEILAIYNSTKPFFNENETVIKTNGTGHYSYTFSAPDVTGNYTVKVNSTYNGEYGEQTAPLEIKLGNSNPTVTALSFSPTTANTSSTIQCNATITDGENATLSVEWWWFNGTDEMFGGNASEVSIDTNTVITTLGSENTTKGETWNCTIRAFDGVVYSTYNSSTITIQNSIPLTPTLLHPADGNKTVHDRTPLFDWSSSDEDGDAINYTINITFSSALACGADIFTNITSASSYTPTYDFCLDEIIYWKVMAFDEDGESAWTKDWNFTIESYLSINLTNKSIDFGLTNPLVSKSTEEEAYNPLVLENNGNIMVNISRISANASLFTAVGLDTIYFRFKADTDATEADSFNTSGSTMDWANVTDIAVENVTVIKELDYNDTHDTAEIDINITVPENEPPGNKLVTIYIIGEQA